MVKKRARYLPEQSIIFWIYSFDEKYGFSNFNGNGYDWNQFRVIQHEWMYSNLPQSLATIKCWLQYNKQMKFDNTGDINSNNIDHENNQLDIFEKCPQIFFNDKKYYFDVNKKIIPADKRQKRTLPKKYKQRNVSNAATKALFDNYYLPCNKALHYLLNHRRYLLLGNWIEWDIGLLFNKIQVQLDL